jgi:hypothetical protein
MSWYFYDPPGDIPESPDISYHFNLDIFMSSDSDAAGDFMGITAQLIMLN